MEISFIVEAGALRSLEPEMSGTEAGILRVFDAARERVHEAADKVYARGQEGSYAYILGAEDI